MADDIQRLVGIILDELAAMGSRPPAGRCGCHALHVDCCPDRVQGVLDAGRGATRAARDGRRHRHASPALIDHTLLKPDASLAEIEVLCREAAEHRFASVCVNPTWVATCARLLKGSTVTVCSVVGFPLGATTADVKQYETRRALFDGAREIDMVINVGRAQVGRACAWWSATSRR